MPKLELIIPDRCLFTALYLWRNGWSAQVRADESWLTPYGSSHYGASAGVEGYPDAQSAIDAAYEKLVITLARLDAEPRRALPIVRKPEPKFNLDLSDVDLGGLDL